MAEQVKKEKRKIKTPSGRTLFHTLSFGTGQRKFNIAYWYKISNKVVLAFVVHKVNEYENQNNSSTSIAFGLTEDTFQIEFLYYIFCRHQGENLILTLTDLMHFLCSQTRANSPFMSKIYIIVNFFLNKTQFEIWEFI